MELPVVRLEDLRTEIPLCQGCPEPEGGCSPVRGDGRELQLPAGERVRACKLWSSSLAQPT